MLGWETICKLAPMKASKFIYLILLSLSIIGYSEPSAASEKTSETIVVTKDSNSIDDKSLVDSTAAKSKILHIDSSKIVPAHNNPNDLVKGWSTEDFIISCESEYFTEDLMYQIEYDRAIWSGTYSPFIATFKGNWIGDYFHLDFENDTGYTYDFGFGNNDYGEFELFIGESYEDNPKYLNKKFKVYWEWKPSVFPCCSGAYQSVEAYIPSIVKLELVE